MNDTPEDSLDTEQILSVIRSGQVHDLPFTRCQDAVLDAGSATDATVLAVLRPHEDPSVLQRFVRDRGTSLQLAEFAASVPGADLDDAVQVLIERGDEELIVRLVAMLRLFGND